jgi:RND family efflux transporter MFP subunit
LKGRLATVKNAVIYTLLIIVIAALIAFNLRTVRRVSERPPPAEPPKLSDAPVAVYGLIEPAGREVAISPRESGVVKKLGIAEGDTVRRGQVICVLDNSIAQAELEAARARLSLGRKTAELSRDEFERNVQIAKADTIAEAELTRSGLKMEADERQVGLHEKELELAQARLDYLLVAAPRDGIVYLCDIRVGEYFPAGDATKIVIGPRALQVRCDVEVVWIGKFSKGRTYRVYNADTGDPVGTATYRTSSRYLRGKRIRTEDPSEKLSARYQEVTLDFQPDRGDIPIYLPVLVRPGEP